MNYLPLQVGEKKVDITKGPFVNDQFTITSRISPDNRTDDFIVFESKKCGINVGFFGEDLKSAAVVNVPCYHGGQGKDILKRRLGVNRDCLAVTVNINMTISLFGRLSDENRHPTAHQKTISIEEIKKYIRDNEL